MRQRIILLMLGWAILLTCSGPGDETVIWKPSQPVTGEKITVIFNPQRLIKPEKQELTVFLICQQFLNNTIKPVRIPMIAKKNYWQAEIKPEPGTYLLRVKFEDHLDRVEDNQGVGWHLIIRDRYGNEPQYAHARIGLMYSQSEQAGFIPNYQRAHEEFQRELLLFPENYSVWYTIWDTRLRQLGPTPGLLNQISTQLDSLLKHEPASPELHSLAFKTYARLLNDPAAALKQATLALAAFQSFPNRDEMEYSVIQLKYAADPIKRDEELIQLADRIKDASILKLVYRQLGFSFTHRAQLDRAMTYFQKYLYLDPDEIHIKLDLAGSYIKKHNYDLAYQLIEETAKSCSEENYFLKGPWDKPEQRRAAYNLDRCRIFSTRASLEAGRQNYEQAIAYRKQSLALFTPFPAFEWSQIGELYLQLGRLDSAEVAFVKAIRIEPTAEAIEKLKTIHLQRGGKAADFYSHLNHAIEEDRKASARVAPDFELMDLNGNLRRLSEQQGKIIVLTFWDSWSTAFLQELPQLNALTSEFKNDPRVNFWAISVEAPVSIKKFISQTPFQYQQFHSGYPVKKLYDIIGFPTHLVIDPQRKIRYHHIGFSDEIGKQLKEEINLLLKEMATIS
ncbi:MAG: redoxin domain-containing protein [candidate division KSB1 bacterium]|nr:redoxin domain-containing protein [candidate division KSB1 bacterium]